MSEDNKIQVSKQEKEDREMIVRRESPWSLFQQMDRLFDDLSSNFFDDMYFPLRRTRPLSLIIRDDEPIFRTPLANITQDDKFFNITAELPGLDKRNIEITIHDRNLEIKGELKEEKKEEKEGSLIRREYHSSKYFRSFALPEYIDEDKIEANLEKGVLYLKIPKVEPPKPEKKKIDIK